MDLPKSIVKEFAKQAVEKKPTVDKPTQLVGTVQVEDGQTFVYLDGSNGSKTPVSETVVYQSGDRVLVSIQNRKATIIGNYTGPSINQALDNVIVEYALSSNSVSFIAWPGEKGEWNTIAPEKEDGSYMWQRTTKISTNPLINPEISLTCIQGSDGENGYTPYIGSNGNWWINGVDTGYSAEGDDGHSPYVNTTTNTWWEWDADIGGYHDTGIVPQGPGVFKSIVFKRFSSRPSTPTGGSYLSPVPSGWSDGVPSGTEQIWISTRVFTSDGESPQTSEWTTPQMASDTADIDFEYSWIVTNPGNPTDNPGNWSNAATENSIWMAVRKNSRGTWSSWEISKIKGEDGEMSAEQLAQLNQASEDASTAKTDASAANTKVDNIKIGGANIIQDMSKWYISPKYGFINKANAHENLIARKNDNVFRADGVVNSGVTFTRIDGSNTAWHIEGTATATLDYVVTGTDKESYALPITIGTYTLSKTIKNNSGDEPQVMISVSNSSMAYKTQYNTNGNSVSFTTPTDAKFWRYCGVRLVSGKTYNCDVYIKLESGSSATPYSIAPSDLENDADTVVLTKRATANWSNNIKPYPIIKMSDAWGKDLTLSFDWKATSDTEQPSLGFYTFKDAMMPNIWGVAGAYNMPRIANLVVGSKVGGYIVNLENNKISSNWTRCVVTFRIDSADWFTTGSELYDYFGFNIVSYYGSTENTLYIKNVKFEIGNKATSWTPSTDETTKLLKRVVIGDDSVNIVDSTGKLLASYGDAKIELGKNAVSSVIEMCGGMARVSARYGGLTSLHSNNGSLNTTLDYDFNETTFKSKVGSNYGSYEFIYSGGVWECSYSGNSAGYVRVSLSDYGITLKTTSVNEYAGITINYWDGSEATFINAYTTKPSRKLIFGLAESGTTDNTDYVNFEIERSKESDGEHSKINLLTVHDGANFAGVHLDNGNIELNSSGEVLINQYNIVQMLIDMLCCADTESITVTAGTFTDGGCSATLAGNTLYLYLNAKAKAAITAGNIKNQTMLTITFTDNRILALYSVTGSGGSSGPNSQMQFSASSNGGQHTITVTLAAIAQNIAKDGVINAHVSMPCVLNWDAYPY